MSDRAHAISRRRFLGRVSVAATAVGGLASARTSVGESATSLAPARASSRRSIYAGLGVRPLINAAGTYTALSASLMAPEVVAAMHEASREYVSIAELQDAVGRRIATLLGAEAALVTSGCAAALTLATAACVAGKDEDRIHRVPDTAGMKNEVVLQKSHRFNYDHAIRNVGVTLVEAETLEGLEAAVNDRTAMLFYLNNAAPKSAVSREEFVRVARAAGVPSLIDAAADVPPAANLTAFTKMGFDLVAFSGGKGLRGPQCSGLLLGRQDLIEAAFANGSPRSDSIGRMGKVGKEEIVGLLTALEIYLKRDHDADWKEWERQVEAIGRPMAGLRGVKTERFVPEVANEVPHLAITWDPAAAGLTREDFVKSLRDGEPRIEVRPGLPDEPRSEIGVWMLQPNEHKIVARRCREILQKAASSSNG